MSTRALDVFAAGDWDRGGVLGSSSWPFRPRWIVVPAETLTDQLIADGLARWYRERFAWRRRHWSQLEGRLPEIAVDLAWERPKTLYAPPAVPVSAGRPAAE